jgi:hypothetical protein
MHTRRPRPVTLARRVYAAVRRARQVRHQVSQIVDREAWAPDDEAAQPVPCQRSSFAPSPIHDSDPAGASIAKSHGRLG